MNELLQHCIHYLKNEPGLNRLMPKFIEKYQSLGRLGGSVKLTALRVNEREALSAFFRKDYTKQATATISFTAFEQALTKTKYAELPILDILEAYEGKQIKTNTERQMQKEQEKSNFFDDMRHKYPVLEDWLSFIEAKGSGTRAFHILYEKNRTAFQNMLQLLATALENLPEKSRFERLPLFAQRIAKNPHAFDVDQELGRAFLHVLQFLAFKKGEAEYIKYHYKTEEISEILQRVHIFRDDLLNFVTVCGLMGWIHDQPTATLNSSVLEQTVLNLPLREIVKLTNAMPHLGRRVFVVENSGVYSAILDHWPLHFAPPLICTHGQFKLAAFMLFDLLVKANIEIYYAGDFDPAGILMAQRMKQRYGAHVTLWRYEVTDYEKALSAKEIALDQIIQLNRVDLPELQAIKHKMWETMLAGYQEELITDMIRDMELYYLTGGAS